MNSIDVPQLMLETKYWVYTYHMPLFFLISAFLFSYYGGFGHKGGYKGTLWAKFERLIIPYIIWNLLFIAPKYFLADYSADHIELTPSYFLHIMLSPRDNILGHTWFLFALFEMFVLAILFEKIKTDKLLWIPMAMILLTIHCFGVENRLLAVGDLMKNGIYFWVGLLLGTVDVTKLTEWAKDKSVAMSLMFICIAGTMVWVFTHDGPIICSMLINRCILGFTIIILLGVLQIRYGFYSTLIEFVSVNSFAIYIMHWPILMVINVSSTNLEQC
jgi:fucose 4-O-acetylase-like acetyltransferase